MVLIILIEKNGTVKQTNSKDLTSDTIYKKCGLKRDCGFGKRTTWNVTIGNEKCSIELWSKDEGKAGTENKFELPEPIDKNLYFGTMAVVRVNSTGNFIDIKTDLWTKVYDKLMGDFDDLEEEEEEEDEEDDGDELASVPKSMKTKSGYLKDGFVVETNSEDEEYVDEVEEEEEADDEDDDDDEEDEDSDDLELDDDDCSEGSELDEESYEYTDED